MEIFSGKKGIIVNRSPKPIDFTPGVKDETFYAGASIFKDYLSCQVQTNSNILTIDKSIDDAAKNTKNEISQDISVMEGGDFEITLVSDSAGTKRWFYSIDNSDAVSLAARRYEDDKKGTSKYIQTFKALKSGEYNIICRYFTPKLGEINSSKTMIYKIKITPKQ